MPPSIAALQRPLLESSLRSVSFPSTSDLLSGYLNSQRSQLNEIARSFASFRTLPPTTHPFDYSSISRSVEKAINSLTGGININHLIENQVNLLRDIGLNTKLLDIEKLGYVSGFAMLPAIQSSAFQRLSDQIGALQSSFAAQLAQAINDALASAAEDSDAFSPVETLIEQKVSTSPPNAVLAEGLRRLFFDILVILIGLAQIGLVVYQVLDAKKSSKEQADFFKRLIEVNEQIAVNTESRTSQQDYVTYYEVERSVGIRLEPSTKSSVVRILYPGHKVRLVERNHKWIFVEYFDYINGEIRYGWLYKKYAQQLR